MIIKCKKTKRFLCKVNIEDYLSNLKDMGISQEIPLRISVPCRECKKIEVYDIYENHYIFIENEKKYKKIG